ncbi:thioredoxin [Calditrichota bacterium]
MSDHIELTEITFDEQVTRSDLPVLVDAWASWCEPCKRLNPVIDQIATEYKGKLKVAKLNVEENSGLAQRFAVTSLPALMVFKDGVPMQARIGMQPKSQIEEMILPYLNGE